MSKYLRKTAALACHVHSAIKDRCIKELERNGFFRKSAVVEGLGFSAVEESIRWDYVAEFITAEGYDLVPLAARFFRSESEHKKEDTQIKKSLIKADDDSVPNIALSRFLAGGHGRKTAGYASVYFANGRLAIKRFQIDKKRREGANETIRKRAERIARNAEGRLTGASSVELLTAAGISPETVEH